jgi:uncharacterized protein (TIGR02118 family)
VSVYVPDETLSAVRNPFPKSATFDALIDLQTESAAAGADAEPTSFAPPSSISAWHAAYRVTERHLRACPRASAHGEPTPGLVLVSPVHRGPALDRASFDRHWRDRHGRLALLHHAGMSDYRQALVEERFGADAPDFDGIARLGFPSATAFEQGFFDSREGRRAIAEDTMKFVDMERTEVALLREIVVKG